METRRIADESRGLRRMFVRDLVLPAQIGVHAHEHGRSQQIRVNLGLGVEDDGARSVSRGPATQPRSGPGADEISRVVDYERIVNGVREMVATGHVRLIETLAERLAELCLADQRVASARVTVEKLDVFEDAMSAGVEIERRR